MQRQGNSYGLLLAAPFFALGLLASSAAMAQECPPPTAAEAEAVARAYIDANNKGDRAALDALLAADYRHQGAVVAEQDRARHLDRVEAVKTAFPDGAFTIDWILVDGDTVAIRSRFNGTHQGDFVGVAASGKPVSVGAFHVHRIACGKIAETWNVADAVGLFRQIGAIPGPATSTPGNEEQAGRQHTADASCAATTPEVNTTAVRRWYDEALNQGKWEALDEILSEDDVHHSGILPDAVGREAVKNALAALRTGFPDVNFTVDDIVTSDDTVLVRWSGVGTHQGKIMGVEPTGKKVTWDGINAFRFACGKIVEGWSEANGLKMLREMGQQVPGG